MAIYHLTIKVHSRSKGSSSISKSAYRAGEKLTNEKTGEVHDYTYKGGVVYSEVALPQNAPKEFMDREKLWNAVELIEKSKNSQLCREFEGALPLGLSREEQIKIVKEFAQKRVDEGMCVDFAIHDKPNNPHFHMLCTMRSIDENGKFMAKSINKKVLDENGQPILLGKDKTGRKKYKYQKVDVNNWNNQENAERWREEFALISNKYLSKEEQIDHRSYKRQGIDREPTIHIGVHAKGMERRLNAKGQNFISERSKMNIEIQKRNVDLGRMELAYHSYKVQKTLIEFQKKSKNNITVGDVKTYLRELNNLATETSRLNHINRFDIKCIESSEKVSYLIAKQKDIYTKKLDKFLSSKATKKEVKQVDLVETANLYFVHFNRIKTAEIQLLSIENLKKSNEELAKKIQNMDKLLFDYNENKSKLSMLDKKIERLSGFNGIFKGKEKAELMNKTAIIKSELDTQLQNLYDLGVKDISNSREILKELKEEYEEKMWQLNQEQPKKVHLENGIKESKSIIKKIENLVPESQKTVFTSLISDIEKKEKHKINEFYKAHEKEQQISALDKIIKKSEKEAEKTNKGYRYNQHKTFKTSINKQKTNSRDER